MKKLKIKCTTGALIAVDFSDPTNIKIESLDGKAEQIKPAEETAIDYIDPEDGSTWYFRLKGSQSWHDIEKITELGPAALKKMSVEIFSRSDHLGFHELMILIEGQWIWFTLNHFEFEKKGLELEFDSTPF